MTHTFDTKLKIPSAADTTTNANPATGTFACGANATLLTLGMIYGGNSARTGGSPTYGTGTFTQADATRGVTEALAELWYIVSPPKGQTLLISVPNAGGLNMDIFVSSYNAQSGYISSFDVAAGTGTTAANPSVRLTTTANGDAIIGVVGHGANSWNPSSQSGTVIYNEDPSTWGGGAQYILQPSAGLVLVNWTQVSDDYGAVAAAFKETDSGTRSKSLTDTSSGTDVASPYQPSVAYRSKAYAGCDIGSAVSSILISTPVGIVLGDVILAFFSYKYDSNITITEIDVGETWNEVTDATVVNTIPSPDLRGKLLWKRASQTDVDRSASPLGYTYVFSFSATIEVNVHLSVYSGVLTNIANPIEIVNKTTGNGNCTLPSLYMSTKYSELIGFVANNSTCSWSCSTMTERWDQRASAFYSLLELSEGQSGTNILVSSSADEYIGIVCCVSVNGTVSKSLSENGIGTDNVSGLLASLSMSEYSQGTDNLLLLTSLSLYDVGSGIDIESVTKSVAKYVNDIVLRIFTGKSVSISDSGTISETSTISAVLSLIEQGLTSEQISQIASLVVAELGYGIDSSQLASSLGISDVGTILDYLGLSASLALSDVGTIIDVVSTLASLQLLENGLGTDRLSNLTASLSVIDSSQGTDIVSVLVSLLKLVTDTGSGSDQVLNLLASLSVSELSTVLEAVTQLVSLALTETGRGVDSSALAASLGLSDTVLGGDFLGLSALDIINEFANGNDVLPNLLASLRTTESGSASDLLRLLASLSLSDAGSGSDIVNVITATLKAVSDAASGLDGVSISASMSLVDNGSGVDNLSLTVSLTVRDTGLGTDAISVLMTAVKQVLDTASGTDGLTISASLNIPETMYGIDAPTIAASLIGYDIGISSDSPQIQASLTLTDTSSASDILNVLQTVLKIVQDLASGSDFIGSISASIPVSDAVLGADQIAQLLASLMVTDFGTGVDVVIHYDTTTQIIKISFIIKKSAITFAFACPRIEFGLSKKQIEFSFLDGG